MEALSSRGSAWNHCEDMARLGASAEAECQLAEWEPNPAVCEVEGEQAEN